MHTHSFFTLELASLLITVGVLRYSTYPGIVRNLALCINTEVDCRTWFSPSKGKLMLIDRVFVDWGAVDRKSETTTSRWACFPSRGKRPSGSTPDCKAEDKTPNKVLHSSEDERKSLRELTGSRKRRLSAEAYINSPSLD
jgi:hypothetical protein